MPLPPRRPGPPSEEFESAEPAESNDPGGATSRLSSRRPRERRFEPSDDPGGFSLLTADDLYLFNEGTHYRLYEKLGSHLVTADGAAGVYFAVWAPNAEQVFVFGDWNGWRREDHPLRARGLSGIWEGFLPGLERGAQYKYHIVSRYKSYRCDKADPFAFQQQTPPETSSVVWDLEYTWGDAGWLAQRARQHRPGEPISIYEAHLGSWRRTPDSDPRSLRYRELAPGLAHYVKELGFTHVEMLPVMEHPFYGSWGYQTTGYYAPTSRQGRPQDFMNLVDTLHQQGIGVILDWVPSHFPDDPHGLSFFDGTYLFEHADPRKGVQPDWNSLIFNYGRPEVRSFLISNALFWLDRYHADGLRVDAVASMLYLDYSRKEGAWVPNEFGGRENLLAIRFLRQFNEAVHERYPDTRTIAEESTAWPHVSRPVAQGGLGFDHKWDMGWMHDTLRYLKRWPAHRKFHHTELTFRMLYAYQENFVLSLSHDEVVHGKYSLADKMPGDEWHKFANLRLLYAYMYAQPGRKLLFMGAEFGQWKEWNHDVELDWDLLQKPLHAGLRLWVQDLNQLYRRQPALHVLDESPEGFEWIDCHDGEQSVLSMLRVGQAGDPWIVGVFNFTAVAHTGYRVGTPAGGIWKEILNSNAREYGGTGSGNGGSAVTIEEEVHSRPFHLLVTLPPLAAVFFEGPLRPNTDAPRGASELEAQPDAAPEAIADAPPLVGRSAIALVQHLPNPPRV